MTILLQIESETTLDRDVVVGGRVSSPDVLRQAHGRGRPQPVDERATV